VTQSTVLASSISPQLWPYLIFPNVSSSCQGLYHAMPLLQPCEPQPAAAAAGTEAGTHQ
jgi:hypothetical protein